MFHNESRIEELLNNLNDPDIDVRLRAAAQLGELDSSSPEIVKALMDTVVRDDNQEVVRESRKALDNPVHQAEMDRQPPSQDMEQLAGKEPSGCIGAISGFLWLSAIFPAFYALMTFVAIVQIIVEGKAHISGASRSEDLTSCILVMSFYVGDAVLSIALARGLQKGKNWARTTLIVMLLAGIIASFIFGGAGGIIILLIFGFVIRQLAKEADYFK